MLKPVFTSFSQRIWKIFPDISQNGLAIESRDSATKEIFGWAVSLDQPAAVSFELHENWWCSLRTVHEGYAVWQGIEEEGLPIPMGIYVFDQLSGALAWQNSELKFLHCGPEVIIAAKQQEPDIVFFLETQSGTIRDQTLLAELPLDFIEKFERSRFEGWQYPEHLSPDTDHYAEMNKEIPPLAEQVGPMNYLLAYGYQILHRYHIDPSTQEIAGCISVLKEGSPIIADIPTGHYPNGFALDSFFVMNDWLVWVEFPGKLGRLRLV